MRLGRILGGLGVAAVGIGVAMFYREPAAHSADHLDSPATKTDPTVDINDLYTWMDGTNAVFVLTSKFDTAPTTKFSDKVQYVFHTNSGAAFGATTTPFDLIVTFDTANKIQAWYGAGGYVTGDASGAGLTSQDGKFKIFAGPRADPFFFNLEGFKNTVATVESAAGMLVFDPAGCPAIDGATSSKLVTQLKTDKMGGSPKDFFANLNALAIVISIDAKLITSGGPIVSAWASTNSKP